MKQYPVLKARIPSGETIAYRMCGSGARTVVLLHGNMSSSVHWQTTMEALEPYCRVIAPDLRGFGDSSYVKTFDSLRELALDVATFLSLLGIERCAVAGWSAGGGVAMELAAEYPSMVKKLILLDSVPLTGYPMFRKDASGQPILTELLKTKEDVAADAVQVLPVLKALQDGNREFMRAIWNATVYPLNQPPEADYEEYLTAILKQRCLIDLDYALLTFNISHRDNGVAQGNRRMDLISCNIFILQGEKDIVVPKAWAEQMKADFGDRAQYITFVKAGHSAITDDPSLFFSTLKGILGVNGQE